MIGGRALACVGDYATWRRGFPDTPCPSPRHHPASRVRWTAIQILVRVILALVFAIPMPESAL